MAFTRWTDRPIAISGLEKRLLRDLSIQGGFGVFDDRRSLFQRSVLWCRGAEVASLERITFLPESRVHVPTWSWMGYQGGIDFLDLPLGGIEPFVDGTHVSWTDGRHGVWNSVDGGAVQISTTARNFDMTASDNSFKIIYDNNAALASRGKKLKCVVIAKKAGRDTPIEEKIHFVLIIKPTEGNMYGKRMIYERVGVGYMAGKFIERSLVGKGEEVFIR